MVIFNFQQIFGSIQMFYIELWLKKKKKNQFSDFCNVTVGHLFF